VENINQETDGYGRDKRPKTEQELKQLERLQDRSMQSKNRKVSLLYEVILLDWCNINKNSIYRLWSHTPAVYK